jgi:hypothetical protein
MRANNAGPSDGVDNVAGYSNIWIKKHLIKIDRAVMTSALISL